MMKFILGITHRALQAFVLMKLWLWIVVPVFLVPAGGYFQFVGVSYFVNVIFLSTETQLNISKKSNEEYLRFMFYAFVLQFYCLALGYLYSLFL